MTKELANQCFREEELKRKFVRLKAILPTGRDGNSSKIVDEFVREHEWELALHVVCDYLLEPTTQVVPAAAVQEIQSLHEALGIEDNCVADLRGKPSSSE